MNDKFELTSETKIYNGTTLHRIKALKDFGNVKKCELGGFVEKEKNISLLGNACVYDNVCVFGNAGVYDNARVFGNARVYDNAWVFGSAGVRKFQKVSYHLNLTMELGFEVTIGKDFINIGCQTTSHNCILKICERYEKNNNYRPFFVEENDFNKIKKDLPIIKAMILRGYDE